MKSIRQHLNASFLISHSHALCHTMIWSGIAAGGMKKRNKCSFKCPRTTLCAFNQAKITQKFPLIRVLYRFTLKSVHPRSYWFGISLILILPVVLDCLFFCSRFGLVHVTHEVDGILWAVSSIRSTADVGSPTEVAQLVDFLFKGLAEDIVDERVVHSGRLGEQTR